MNPKLFTHHKLVTTPTSQPQWFWIEGPITPLGRNPAPPKVRATPALAVAETPKPSNLLRALIFWHADFDLLLPTVKPPLYTTGWRVVHRVAGEVGSRTGLVTVGKAVIPVEEGTVTLTDLEKVYRITGFKLKLSPDQIEVLEAGA